MTCNLPGVMRRPRRFRPDMIITFQNQLVFLFYLVNIKGTDRLKKNKCEADVYTNIEKVLTRRFQELYFNWRQNKHFGMAKMAEAYGQAIKDLLRYALVLQWVSN